VTPLASQRSPSIAVNDILERPPVRAGHGGERTIRGVAERDEPGAKPVTREAEELPGKVLVGHRRVATTDAESVAAMSMAMVAWPRSYWIDSRVFGSGTSGATNAMVAADPATCRAPRQTVARSTRRRLSVTTMRSQRCWFGNQTTQERANPC